MPNRLRAWRSGGDRGNQTGGISDERQLGSDVDERREQRVEDAGRGESDADDIYGEGACKICEYDAAASARHADGLGNVQQIVTNQQNVGALTRDVGPAT